MTLTRRLPLAAVLALTAAALIPTTSVADLFPAGNFDVMTVTADAFSFTSMPPYSQASMFVQSTTTQANPLVGPSSTTRVVQVSLFWSGTDANGNPVAGNGCSVLGTPTDFVVASGATGASLQTTFTGSEQPCDQFEQVLPAALSVSATWTSTVTRGTGRTSSQYTCGSYKTVSLGTSANFGANATFSISALGGSFSDDEASFASGDQNTHASGTPASTCLQLGGKGAGPGPQAPGRYTFNSTGIASFGESPSNNSDPRLGVFVNQFTNTSIPQGTGAPSVTRETDVTVFVQGSAGFGFGCFVLKPPATFTFSLTSAALSMTLDSANQCQPAFGDFPFLPSDLTVTWSGIGPLTTMHSDSQGSCVPDFSEQTFFDDTNNNATAAATMSFFEGITFNGDQSSLGTSDHSFQILGATRCPSAH